MSSQHLKKEACVLRVRLSLDHIPDKNEAGNKLFLQKLKHEIENYIEENRGLGINDLSWKLQDALSRTYEKMHDFQRALQHVQNAIGIIEAIAKQLTPNAAHGFLNHPERKLVRVRYENLMRIQSNDGGVPVAEFEQEHLRILYRVSSTINTIRDARQIFTVISDCIIRAFNMDKVMVQLQRPDGIFNWASDGDESCAMPEFEKEIRDKVSESGYPFLTGNAASDQRLSGGAVKITTGAIFCTNLIVCGRKLGVLYACSKTPIGDLKEETINLFAAIGSIFAATIDNAIARERLLHENQILEQYFAKSRSLYPEIIGKSRAVIKLQERISLAAASPLDILICGESGTGKELVAQAIYRTGKRTNHKFTAMDCGSLSETLVESELFGYRKGSFTGATENRLGLFEIANGGILFFDEIANLSLKLQGKLLRVLQEREVRRIGDSNTHRVDVQIIAATNRDLREEVASRKFRKDLFFRLNIMEIQVPPLRERDDDTSLLLEYFLKQVCEGGIRKKFTQEAWNLLNEYKYPGNIRELKNIVYGAYYSTPSSEMDVVHLPSPLSAHKKFVLEASDLMKNAYRKVRDGVATFNDAIKTPFLKREIGADQVREIMHMALVETDGNYKKAFRRLHIPESQYAILIQFLKRNSCFLDFRQYRK
jgi:transcriptional regulator with GAF, ATPase, and Fis domain